MDINVTDIWLHNITGEGVVVAVIDDGLEWTNPDIRDNYSPQGSCDLNSGDDNPMPELHPNGKNENRHGTRCAGEIAAVANKKCGVGVAFGAKVAGIRLLDGPMTDSLEATAFNKHMQVNDIYSCSWGPDDDGKTVDGPHPLALAALQHGVNSGRRGRGSVFVVASGNGGRNQDNCNYDGYANSMYTITIGAINEVGLMPYYAEECSALLGVTFSSGTNKEHRNIVTTDWTLGKDKGCTNGHTGTSAAAPLAAGLIALSLQAKPCLSWRDVQHLIVYSSFMVDPEHGDWSDNAAGFHHSHKHGFGEIKAWRLVNAAKVWRSVPWLTSLSSSRMSVYKTIPANNSPLVLNYKVTNSSAQFNEIATLEHVLVTVSLTHPSRGSLRIELISPSGTTSVLATPRKLDVSPDGLKGWTFSTVRCWGEQPSGDWILKIFDTGQSGEGILQEWKLVLYGSMISPEEVQQRRQTVEDAMSGVYLDANLTEPCSFYWNPAVNEDQLLTTKTMRMLLLVSALITILAAYYTLEQAFCNQEDKDKYLEEYIDLERTRLERSKSSSNGDISSNNVAETRLVPPAGDQVINNVELTIETENSLIVAAEISPLSQKGSEEVDNSGRTGGADSSGKHRQEDEVICVDNSKPMSQVHKHSKEKLSETVAYSSSNCEALSAVNLGFASEPFEDGTESGDLGLLSDQSAIYKLERTQPSGTINNILSSHGNEENIDEISECEPFLS
ncbi:proprotein convertase subtilisin/kexin type 7-like isoform X2 [Apostichopus japonicus]